MILYMTGTMDLARGSKVFSMFFLHGKDSKTKSHPSAFRALAPSQLLPPRWRVHRWTPWASNFIRKMSYEPALVCPSRELPVSPATQALPTLSTCAKIDSWALQCSTDAHGNSKKNWGRSPQDREKMKWRSMITPNHCKCKNYEKHWKPPCPTVSGWKTFKPRNLNSTPIYQHIQSGLKCPIFPGMTTL